MVISSLGLKCNKLINTDHGHNDESKFICFVKLPSENKPVAIYPWQVIATICGQRTVSLYNSITVRYYWVMIKNFKCKETEKIWNEQRSKKFPPSIQTRALRKLRLLDSSERIQDLKIPPSNHLESLSGDRIGQYSIFCQENAILSNSISWERF